MNNNEPIVKVVIDHEKLIHAISNNFSKNYDKDDLFQVGVIGLMKAYKNFDSSLGVKFSTYAYSYILGEIKAYVRSDKQFKVSRDIIRLNSSVEHAKSLLAQRLMREPSIIELSLFLEIDEEKITEALNLNNVISFDEPINDTGKEITLYDMLGEEKKIDLGNLIDLRDELNSLSPFEKRLIESRYYNDNTQMETANILGMSQVQVSRSEQKVLTKLRQRL
jgi:RNA polymerase sporulation-specific sigma factor